MGLNRRPLLVRDSPGFVTVFHGFRELGGNFNGKNIVL
jgi:hypothetical protein